MRILIIFLIAIFFPFNIQASHAAKSDCGPQALLALLEAYHIPASLEQLEKLSDLNEEGTTLNGLKTAAESYGLEAKGLRLNYDELKTMANGGYGVIAFIHASHYVLVKKVTDEGVTYKDLELDGQFADQRTWKEMWLKKVDIREGIDDNRGLALVTRFRKRLF